MVKPVSDGSEYNRGYQQALNDFGITQLLSGIRSYSDEDFDADRARMTGPEIESFAVFLILRVGANLKGSTIARYLNTLRKANSPTIADRPAIELNSNSRGKTPEKSNEGDGYAPACAYALLGRSSEFYRMLNTIQLPVLSTAKMRTIGGGLCVGLFEGVCLKLCAINPNQ
ncbi:MULTISPECIES: hypothetical protein [unclassified Microcoleus]|uniref:hypothetical protein n=1 Tax=unclassified Microcoleus TaxID=2642155 RepID=UPI002FD264C8